MIRCLDLSAATATRQPTAFPSAPGPVSPASGELRPHGWVMHVLVEVLQGTPLCSRVSKYIRFSACFGDCVTWSLAETFF